MADTDRRPVLLRDAVDLLDRAAEKSAERSWRRTLLQATAQTVRRTRRKIDEDPEDEIMPEPASTAEDLDPNDPWAEFRTEGGRP